MTETSDFIPLLVPRDNVELELGKGLLEGEGIPYAIGASDRVELLEVFSGASAQGMHCILVAPAQLARAIAVLEEAWGPDTFRGRDPRP